MHETVLHLWKPTSLALTASAAGAMVAASLAGPAQAPALPNPAPAIRAVATAVDQGLDRIGGLKGEASGAVAGIQADAQDLGNQTSADVAAAAGQVQGEIDAVKRQSSAAVTQAATTLDDTADGAASRLSAVESSALRTVRDGQDAAGNVVAGVQGQLTATEHQASATISSAPRQLTGTVDQVVGGVSLPKPGEVVGGLPLPKVEADADVRSQGAALPSYDTRLVISSK